MTWITPTGRSYKLCLLDTNIISEIVKNPSVEGKGFLTRFGSFVPCISVYSLIELRRNQLVYSSFISMFSVIPFFITKPFIEILEEEFQTHSKDDEIIPIKLAISPLNRAPNLKLNQVLEKVFSDEAVKAAENRWRRDETSVLNSWMGRLDNFLQESPTANSRDADRYWEEAGLQTIIFLNPSWAKEKVETGHLIDANHFLSVKAMLYSQYYRLYVPYWKPRPQEITDIQIITVAPYVDACSGSKVLDI